MCDNFVPQQMGLSYGASQSGFDLLMGVDLLEIPTVGRCGFTVSNPLAAAAAADLPTTPRPAPTPTS